MQTVTELLIDFSSSMQDKLSLTKSTILNDILPILDFSTKIGVKTFSATNDKVPQIKTLLQLSLVNKEVLSQIINALGTPDGNSPIAAAIKNSILSLKEYSAFDKKIILITDGEENCGGDYKAEAQQAIKEGVNCQIHIIGIGLNQAAENQAKEISILSKGSYNFIPFSKGTVYNQSSIKSNLSGFYSSVRTSVPQGISTIQNLHSIVSPVSNPNRVIPSVTPFPPKPTSPPPPIASITPDSPIPTNTMSKLADLKEPVKIPEVQSTNGLSKVEKELDAHGGVEEVQFSNETVKLIVSEIKSIKDQLSSLKKDKTSDIEEDPVFNERVRKSSEEYLHDLLKKKYGERVKWLNKDGESYADHDFEILDFDGSIEIYIECKGTSQEDLQFYLTKNEWRLFLNHTKNYQIYFIKASLSNPHHIYIDNLLDWLLRGKIVPYTREKRTFKEDRVVLTILE